MGNDAKQCWDRGVLHLRTRAQAIESFVVRATILAPKSAHFLHCDKPFKQLIMCKPYLGLPAEAQALEQHETIRGSHFRQERLEQCDGFKCHYYFASINRNRLAMAALESLSA